MSSVESLTRYRDRASQDRQALDALLDEVLVATVSTVVDGMPWSVPMFFARDGDRILLHGSTGAGMLRHLAEGTPATVSVFALDAVVVAETAFESSADYRSALLPGSCGVFSAEPERGGRVDADAAENVTALGLDGGTHGSACCGPRELSRGDNGAGALNKFFK